MLIINREIDINFSFLYLYGINCIIMVIFFIFEYLKCMKIDFF